MSQLSESFISLRRRIMENDFSHMNKPQQQAVFTTEGPVLILAGAGSGKTTVLINRAASLLRYGSAYYSDRVPASCSPADIAFLEAYADSSEHSDDDKQRAAELLRVDPPHAWQIMTITFTNKAASELKQRLSDMLGDISSDIWAMTFHASCARILRRDANRLGFDSKFAIYDADDQKRMIKAVMRELNIDDKNLPEKSVIGEISHAKDKLIDCAEFERLAGSDFRLQQISKIYTAYQNRLKTSGAMDFDDLVFNTVKLLESDSEVREYYQRRFRYVMVDEYQDTNKAQYQLIRLLSDQRHNLCVVGDDDQSIYKFRGATIENILNFEKHFNDSTVIRLEQNYRSTQNILDAANSVIANNVGRHQKTLWSAREKGEPIIVFNADNERAEADYIASRVNEWVTAGGKYSDCAVLYRMSALSSMIENHLMRAGIPYKVVAGRKFYDRKEIRDAIAYLSVINNPADDVRLSRIINEPKRGIGDRTFQNASDIAAGLGITTFEVIGTADQFAGLAKSASKLMPFHNTMRELIDMAGLPDVQLDELLDAVLRKTGYIDNLIKTDEKSQERIENLNELKSTLMRYQSDHGEDATLQGFLEDVALITDIDTFDSDTDCVSLMTLHAAKGLEFPIVFIPGAEDGIFPSSMTMMDTAEIEEDRRLAYVGITRAKDRLHFIHCTYRMLFGHTVHNHLSMYVDEIDPLLVVEKGGRKPQPTMTYEERKKQPRKESASAINARHISVDSGNKASAVGFNIGDTVKHRIFGEGKVLSSRDMGNDTLLEIEFAKVGTKKLMANFAGLKKL